MTVNGVPVTRVTVTVGTQVGGLAPTTVSTAVSMTWSPATAATDLAGLPPAYLDVGSAEIFRDEAVAYATSLWHAGGDAELHVWNGGFHAFDIFAPHTTLAQGMIRTRTAWVENRLAD